MGTCNRRATFSCLLFIGLLTACSMQPSIDPNSPVTGTYNTTNAQYAGELILRSDGRFIYSLITPERRESATGNWSPTDKEVVLDPEGAYPQWWPNAKLRLVMKDKQLVFTVKDEEFVFVQTASYRDVMQRDLTQR